MSSLCLMLPDSVVGIDPITVLFLDRRNICKPLILNLVDLVGIEPMTFFHAMDPTLSISTTYKTPMAI